MQTDREKRICIMRRSGTALLPVSQADEEIINDLGPGDVEVKFAKRRSNPQLRLYWQMLKRAVDATDAYPNSERLHEAIKMHLGYTVPIKTFDGGVVHIADSVAFSKMDGAEFKGFMDRAVALLASSFGFDPLDFYDEK
jgi:hypothetical protein